MLISMMQKKVFDRVEWEYLLLFIMYSLFSTDLALAKHIYHVLNCYTIPPLQV